MSTTHQSLRLSPAEIEQFMELGFVKVEGALTAELAERCARHCLELAGIDENDPRTIPKLQEGRVPFERAHDDPRVNWYDLSVDAIPLWEACCDLMGGPDRIQQPARFRDAGIIRMFDPALTWAPPTPSSPGWHVDGGNWFRHYLDSREQGLLVIVLFRDCKPKGGGTFFVADSPGHVSRFYAQNPVGRTQNREETIASLHQCKDFREVTGKAGDAFVLHPFMIHTGSVNTRPTEPRLMENSAISFKQRMQFNAPDPASLCVVERSILRHLGVDRLDFVRQNE